MEKAVMTALAMLVLSAPGAGAQDAGCAEAEDQISMTACADHVFTMAEADLKRAYGAVKARLDDQALEQLKAAQRAWTAYRHEWCDFIARPWRGGSIYPMIHAQCLTELTEAQTEKLWAQSGCEEGDLFCTGG